MNKILTHSIFLGHPMHFVHHLLAFFENFVTSSLVFFVIAFL